MGKPSILKQGDRSEAEGKELARMMDTIAAAVVRPKTSASPGHLPSLDGLRAISISLVLLGHLSGTHGFLRLNLGIGDYAHLGVTVFFVISGFLITRLLLSEHAHKGNISLKLFYARRTLRLFPACYAYIACMFVLWVAGMVSMHKADFWHSITYTVNCLPERSWDIGHLWSLSVEEQFYLIWPCAVVLLGPRRNVWAAAAMILLGPVARLLARLFFWGNPYYDSGMFPLVADSLAIGCLLARMRDWLEGQNWYLRLFRPVWSLGLLATLLLVNRYMEYTIVWIAGMSLVNIIIAILIHRSVYYSEDTLGKILNCKPFVWVGILSYSLYLWQQPFLNRASTAWANAFPQNLIFAIFAALASYWLLEKPLLKFRQRLRV